MTRRLDARLALAGLAARGVDWRLPVDRALAGPVAARRAAVLVLFGRSTTIGSPSDEIVSPDDLDVLLLQRADTLRHHPGQIGFPGGRLEPGDADVTAAAVREAVEETGLDPSGLELYPALPDLPLPVSNHLVTPVPAWWLRPSLFSAVSDTETVDVFRMPVAALLDPANRRSVERVRGVSIPRSPAFEAEGRLVWGFTAIVLSGMFDALGWSRPWDDDRLVEPTL